MPAASRRTVLAATTALAAAPAFARPAEASPTLPPRTVATRRRFFGHRNVDEAGRVRRDRVVLSWFGVGNYALAIGGRVVLLDAWVPRGAYSGYVPVEVDDLVALRPSHVFIGHGHFDHAADAPTIASASGAVVVGTAEHCAQVSSQSGGRARTRALVAAGAAEGATAAMTVGPVTVDVVKHVHSAAEAPTGQSAPLLLPPDLGPCLEHPPTLQDGVDTLSHQGDQEGGTLAYRFRFGDFSLVWHDTSGPLRSASPRAYDRLRRWRRPSVQVGSIQGFGQFTNGLRDPMWYVEALRPRVFVPGHHDNWQPPITAPASSYEGRLREALAQVPGETPKLRMLRDPEDYARPVVFAVRP
jgi:L-ascorbate metabolism protein UlaG (beta-lactamase superfamily)